MKWLNGYRIRLVLIGFVIARSLVHISMCQAAEPVWTQKAEMPTPRWFHSASVVDDKIYAIGGWPSEPSDVGLSAVETYDPTTDTWTKKADMLEPRGYHSSSVVNGKIYVIGGCGVDYKELSTVEEYDPATDKWTKKADMPTSRFCLSTCVVNGQIYAIGGAVWGNPVTNTRGMSTVEVYDPVTDTWTRKADKPTGVWGLCANVVNGKIYAFGGRPDLEARPYVEEYDPAIDTWTRKAYMLRGTSNMASAVSGDKIIVIGGWRHSNAFPYTTVQMYDPETDIWAREADASFQRACFSASVVNNRVYVIGGTDKPHSCRATSTVYKLGTRPPDFNGDGIVDADDMCIMIDHWGTDEPLCDIGPMPWGDGIVDVQDLIVLTEHLFEEVFSEELVAYWKLDETEGDIAYDSIGVNDGICHGEPFWQPAGGKLAGALELDGIDDYVGTPYIISPAYGDFSVFAWIKGGGAGQVILSQGSGVNWLMADLVDGALKTDLKEPGMPGRKPIPPGPPLTSSTVVTNGDWHRVGFVRDGRNRILYVDDIEVARDTATDLEAAGGGLYIGAGSNLEQGTFWSGLIDDVRIYNRAVSP